MCMSYISSYTYIIKTYTYFKPVPRLQSSLEAMFWRQSLSLGHNNFVLCVSRLSCREQITQQTNVCSCVVCGDRPVPDLWLTADWTPSPFLLLPVYQAPQTLYSPLLHFKCSLPLNCNNRNNSVSDFMREDVEEIHFFPVSLVP